MAVESGRVLAHDDERAAREHANASIRPCVRLAGRALAAEAVLGVASAYCGGKVTGNTGGSGSMGSSPPTGSVATPPSTCP